MYFFYKVELPSLGVFWTWGGGVEFILTGCIQCTSLTPCQEINISRIFSISRELYNMLSSMAFKLLSLISHW